MSETLTYRQTQILKAVVEEYLETAEAVGSDTLDKKYSLGVSSATIRNEMSVLTKSGFLKQIHTSAGRLPTPMAIKFYINQLMEEKQLSVADEVKAKEEVWDSRDNVEKLLAEAVHALSRHTNCLSVAALDNGKVWHSGYSHVFANPEFEDLRVLTNLFELLEQASRIQELFFGKFANESNVEVLFGEELGWPGFLPIGIVATQFKLRDKNAALGVIGPTRLSYSSVIPALRYFGSLMQEII